MNNNQVKDMAIFAALAVLMAATRDHHFGSMLHLPDASLAIFLLAGFYLPRWAFPVLLIEAGAADYLAINFGGVSGWCFSPAYWFLIPTYFTLWLGGRFCAARYRFSLRGLGEFSGIAFAAVCAAFLISNFSFYFFSDYFADMGVTQYAMHITRYFMQYLQGAFLYLAAAVLLHVVVAQSSLRRSQRA
ncbi:MAG: hypothetical protein IPM27_09120 [Nitrosomonadales bacterium]|nr:hypothetical protein [Nitrosomonadales bacterium]